MKEHIAIVGAGNGGQAFAGYLSLMGEHIKIFDVFPATVEKLNEVGGVLMEGNSKYKGFGKIELASTNMKDVIEGAKLILIVLPSLYHADMARQMAPYLKDGQVIVLNPHASMGPVEFKNVLNECGVTADVTIGCTSTLLFACRAVEIGKVVVAGQKQHLFASAYPSSRNQILVDMFKDILPEFEVVDDVIRTSLENINAYVHPAPSILNTGRIESGTPFEYYLDCTPAQGRYIDALDKERMALAAAYGLDHKMKMLVEEYKAMYRCHGDNMYEILTSNEDLKGIRGQKSLDTRYIMEDVPCSLVALQSLGKIAGVPTPCIDAMITVARTLLPHMIEGRTVKNLGLEGVSKEEFIKMCRG
ncbi:MAG: NAD/NADP octopine/nopaline dehydrogenase family protein [Pyramidobacter sp.]|nr:NAD/NADP octopine/nopaline dehydrogenase family protein [Pyramidobacter sp.]